MKKKKFATMTSSGASVQSANSKEEAARKLGVKVKDVYRYDSQ